MGIGWDGYRLGWLIQGNTHFQRLTLALGKDDSPKTVSRQPSTMAGKPHSSFVFTQQSHPRLAPRLLSGLGWDSLERYSMGAPSSPVSNLGS